MLGNQEFDKPYVYELKPDDFLRFLCLNRVDRSLLENLVEMVSEHRWSQFLTTKIPEWGITIGQLIQVIDQSLLEVNLGSGTQILGGVEFVKNWLTNPTFLETPISVTAGALSDTIEKVNELKL